LTKDVRMLALPSSFSLAWLVDVRLASWGKSSYLDTVSFLSNILLDIFSRISLIIYFCGPFLTCLLTMVLPWVAN
jgi:hypothetical protein